MDKYSPLAMLTTAILARGGNPETAPKVAAHCVAMAAMVQRLLDRKSLTNAQETTLARRCTMLSQLLRPYGLTLGGGWGTTLVAVDGPTSIRLTGK